MKAVKGFVKTCYSELLVANATAPDNGDEKAGDASKTDDTTGDSMYLGGLGLKFKFPGDPKKWVISNFNSCVRTLIVGKAEGSFKNEAVDQLPSKCVCLLCI